MIAEVRRLLIPFAEEATYHAIFIAEVLFRKERNH